MILANYLSAWIGFSLYTVIAKTFFNYNLGAVPGPWQSITTAWGSYLRIEGILALVSLIVEWPFIYFCVGRGPRRFWRSGVANLFVHAVTYGILWALLWFNLTTTNISLYTDIELVSPDRISASPGTVIYYLGRDDHAVHRLRLDDGSDEVFTETIALGENPLDARLIWKQNETGDAWQIYLWKAKGYDDSQLVLDNVAPIAALHMANPEIDTSSFWYDNMNQDYRPMNERELFFNVSKLDYRISYHHEKDGITLQDRPSGEIAFDTPFGSIPFCHLHILPGNQLIFQAGPGEICLFDFPTMRMTVLAHGYGPTVALERPMPEKTSAPQTADGETEETESLNQPERPETDL